jgi:hypothetical protein
MASNSDVGHTRNLANFFEVIQKGIGLGPKYDPSNVPLKTGKMNVQYNECKAAQDDLTAQEAIYDPVQNARVLKFAGLNKWFR